MINWQKPEEQIVGVKQLVANVGELFLQIYTRKTRHTYSRYSHNDSIQYLTQHTLYGKNKITNINLEPTFFDIGVNIKQVKEYAENLILTMSNNTK